MPSQKRNISHYKSNDNRDKTISSFIILQTSAVVCTDFAEVWRLGNLAYTLSSHSLKL